jgi:16S rRNA processing protein RimM
VPRPAAKARRSASTSKTDVGEPTVVVGVVAKAHGLRGEVGIQNRSDNPDRWIPGSVVIDEQGRRYTVESVRPQGQRLLVKFAGIADRTTAEALRGATLVVPESWLPALAEGEWWPHELEGCEIVTESGRSLGVLAEVIPNPANDLWVARSEDGEETLVPALKDLLVDVDVDAKRIVVRDVPGITVPDA